MPRNPGSTRLHCLLILIICVTGIDGLVTTITSSQLWPQTKKNLTMIVFKQDWLGQVRSGHKQKQAGPPPPIKHPPQLLGSISFDK